MTTTDNVRLKIPTIKSRYVSNDAVSGPDENAITSPITSLNKPKMKRTHITVVANPLNIDDIADPPVKNKVLIRLLYFK